MIDCSQIEVFFAVLGAALLLWSRDNIKRAADLIIGENTLTVKPFDAFVPV